MWACRPGSLEVGLMGPPWVPPGLPRLLPPHPQGSHRHPPSLRAVLKLLGSGGFSCFRKCGLKGLSRCDLLVRTHDFPGGCGGPCVGCEPGSEPHVSRGFPGGKTVQEGRGAALATGSAHSLMQM